MATTSIFQPSARRWWLLILFGVVGGVTAIFAYRTLPKEFSSTVTLELNPGGTSVFLPYNDPGSNASGGPSSSSVLRSSLGLAASYGEILRSMTFARLVADKLKLDADPATIGGAIRGALTPNTDVYRITVTWDNPTDAEVLAQRITEIFLQENADRQLATPGARDRLNALEQTAVDLQSRLTPLDQQRARLEQAVNRGDLTALRDLNDLEGRLSTLQGTYGEVLVEINRIHSAMDTATIIDVASPAKPANLLAGPILIIVGVLAGFGVAVGLANVLESVQDAIRTKEDVAGVAGEGPLRTIDKSTGRGDHSEFPPGLVMLRNPRSRAAEDFRALRASLAFAAVGRSIRTLLVTSPGPKEGKTFVAANLGIAAAQSGMRVLLIDGDLRRPALHARFGISNHNGFHEAIAKCMEFAGATASGQRVTALSTLDGATLDALTGAIATDVAGLSLMTAGHPTSDHDALLGSAACASLVAALGETWDLVIIDSAPIGPVADPLLLAAHTAASLVVARAGRTQRRALRIALAALAQTGQPILGVVLNDFQPGFLARHNPYDYYYYNGYYGNGAHFGQNGRNGQNGTAKNGVHSSELLRSEVRPTTESNPTDDRS